MRKSLFSKTWKQAVAAAFLALLLVVPAGAQGQGGITLKMRGNLEQVLDAVERQSRYLFLNDQVDLNRTVSVNVTDMPVAAALDEIFKGTGIQYRITESMLLGTVTLGIFMAVLFAVITAGIASGASRCPYCGAILIRQYSETCNACGKKLR